jgi:hypothetical protein
LFRICTCPAASKNSLLVEPVRIGAPDPDCTGNSGWERTGGVCFWACWMGILTALFWKNRSGTRNRPDEVSRILNGE